MGVVGKATVNDYTKITFKPDLARFKMTHPGHRGPHDQEGVRHCWACLSTSMERGYLYDYTSLIDQYIYSRRQ